ncbi:hypothetical protein HPL003_11360 [Paenibacillus terrae HPL-003]|uniref:Uncharacterized protein n=1 Tax=Paenibacillus terrae (strain HPL-003) TaxID=985665 RepID=G7VYN9_PAETH|nr:hypothetical protein HPL003_11360 [Paenibacillus terrae HPL-003]
MGEQGNKIKKPGEETAALQFISRPLPFRGKLRGSRAVQVQAMVSAASPEEDGTRKVIILCATNTLKVCWCLLH